MRRSPSSGPESALGNVPGALTGIYPVLPGDLPILHTFMPAIADQLDPVTSASGIAQDGLPPRRCR